MKTAVYACLALLALGIVGQWGLLDLVPGSRPLGHLVTRQQSKDLREFYGALAKVVGSTNDIATTSDFRNTQILAAKIMQANTPGHLVGLEKINGPINERLVAAIGVDGEVPDGPLTAEMRAKLQKVLDQISEDF